MRCYLCESDITPYANTFKLVPTKNFLKIRNKSTSNIFYLCGECCDIEVPEEIKLKLDTKMPNNIDTNEVTSYHYNSEGWISFCTLSKSEIIEHFGEDVWSILERR